MNFNNSLELTQSQKLVMTTALKQSLNILSMSKSELEEEINREWEENPLLEIEKSSKLDWEKYIKNIENSRPIDKNELYYNSDNDISLERIKSFEGSIGKAIRFKENEFEYRQIEELVNEFWLYNEKNIYSIRESEKNAKKYCFTYNVAEYRRR